MSEKKKRRGRPPGPRKDSVKMTIFLARDCATLAEELTAKYGSRLAAIEALIRQGAQVEAGS